MPTASDLVTDLPADFETFGQAVATSMADLLGGTTGQVLSKASNTNMDFTWVTTDDANAIQNSIVDAKGDIVAASANDTPARLAVGNNGEMLVANSAASTGLQWVGNFAAGKQKLLNSDFNIWQRGTTQSVIDAGAVYGSADRWLFGRNGTTGTGTNTVSRQTFTPGQTDVPNNPTYYCRWTVTTLGTSQTRIDLNNYIEDVALFAGQTVNVSFYGKASTARTYEVYLEQNFGSGGSSAVATLIASGTITTGWTRLSVSGTLPSISGKTVGAGNYLRLILRVTSVSAGDVFEFANAQLEAGSVPTSFQTATGNPASELLACQRYYRTGYFDIRLQGVAAAAYSFPTTALPMRVSPTGAFTAAADYSNNISGTPTLYTTGSSTIPNVSLRFVANGNGDTFYGRPYELAAEL